MRTLWVAQAMLSIHRVEVAARRHEVRRIAAPYRMEVDPVHPGRQISDLGGDLHPAGRLDELRWLVERRDLEHPAVGPPSGALAEPPVKRPL